MSNSIARGVMWTVAAAVATLPAAGQQTVKLTARDNMLRERPADVFTVGTVEGESWEMFSGIRSVVFDAADNMYVLDGQNSRIIVFDAGGRFVRQFGKKGGGPGELQAPLAMDLASDGSVVVSDVGNRSFVVFTSGGEYVRNVPFDEELGFPMAMSADRSGGIIGRSMQRPRPNGDPSDRSVSPIIRHSLDGAETRTLYRVPVTPPRVMESGSSGRMAFMTMDPVFGPRPTFGVLPSGIAVHHETGYSIHVLDMEGKPVRRITRDYTPRKVTKKDQEAWQEQRREEAANGGGPTVVMARTSGAGTSTSVGRPSPGAMTFNVDAVPFAEFMSVVTSIRTDPQGRIWVQRRDRDGGAAGPVDLVTSEGRYIGTLPAQALPNAVSASGLAAWVVTDDELGVERVVVRRLPASWR